MAELALLIKDWGTALGFEQVGIAGIDLADHEQHLHEWLKQGFHGEMDYMAYHGNRRSRPADLVPGTTRVISVRMNYLPPRATSINKVLTDDSRGFISRYALGRDYHKLMRKRIQGLATRIEQAIGNFGYRAFVDSAPVLEKALAQTAGLGWIGKHTNLINRQAGSWFFLGELYTDLPLPIDKPVTAHCGHCTACIDICPTQAIISPYKLDARRCISYLTIELNGSIPEEHRRQIGNRIYGCDDCQLVCPWNRFARFSDEKDFHTRQQLDNPELIELFSWDEATFLHKTAGSAIRRIGHHRWLRNIAIALGNSLYRCKDHDKKANLISALQRHVDHPSAMVREHVQWAMHQQQEYDKQ